MAACLIAAVELRGAPPAVSLAALGAGRAGGARSMSDELQRELALVRQQIDSLDGQLLELLNQRARFAQQVGEIKARHGEAGFIYRPEREAQVLHRIQEENAGPLSNETVTWFFREVMSACLSLEQPLGIAFLGPLGTFSESAATKHFGHAARSDAADFDR
jgi:chorismate mutase/prephenate dehydratase